VRKGAGEESPAISVNSRGENVKASERRRYKRMGNVPRHRKVVRKQKKKERNGPPAISKKSGPRVKVKKPRAASSKKGESKRKREKGRRKTVDLW